MTDANGRITSYPQSGRPYPDPALSRMINDPAQPSHPTKTHRPTNRLARASLICAVLGLLTCGAGSLVGAVLGHLARHQIRTRGGTGDQAARAGVIIGWAGTGLYLSVTVLVVLFAVWAAGHNSLDGGHHSHHWHFHH
jgi:hypothetical protein